MQWSYDIILVNPYGETVYSVHSRRNIHVGILSLASYVHRKNYRVKILDCNTDENYLKTTQAFVDQYPTKILAVSSTSCFTYRTLKTIVEKIRVHPESIIIVGGQQVAGLHERIFQDIPSLQYACFDEGETTLLYLLDHFGKPDLLKAPGLVYRMDNTYQHNLPQSLSFEELGPLDYQLYPNYRRLIPAIEESRGCPNRCHFCANQRVRTKVKIKPWAQFITEALQVYDLYSQDKLFISMGCSTFGMDQKNTINLFKALIPHKDKFLIQVWTRCDTECEAWIPYLKELDISSVFFGMETASEQMLLNMNKTRDPKKYIQQSQRLIDLFYENGLKLWCNFIFGYVGETPETLYETLCFILKNKDKIGFLSGHGLFTFPGCQVYEAFETLKEKYGVSFSEKDSYPELHHYKVNPSSHFTFEQITALSQVLLKMVNTQEDFNQVYSWRWLGLDRNEDLLSERMNYLKEHELPYRCKERK